jgi:hypothetical protein
MSDTTSWFDITISRGPISGALRSTIGLIVRVKTDPAVENFMRLHSNDQRVEVGAFGPAWMALSQEPLEAYNVPKLPMNQYAFGRYTVDAVGRPLLTGQRGLGDEGAALNTVNLSFFKLVGISKPEGVRFGVVGAYSVDYITNLNRQLLTEAKQFLVDYITPIDITLKLMKK